MAGGFGMLATVAAAARGCEPFAPKPTHFPAKAKRIIYLVMNGGMSHVDTFDPKPMLTKYNGQPMPGGPPKTERSTGNLFASPFAFRKCGQSGIEVSEIFPRVGEPDRRLLRDSIDVDRGAESRAFAVHVQYGHDSAGAAEPRKLADVRPRVGEPRPAGICGAVSWDAGGRVAAVVVGLSAGGVSGDVSEEHGCRPVQADPKYESRRTPLGSQRRQMDLLSQLNREHLARRPGDTQLEASIEAMETAFRMQTEAPEAFDIRKEKPETLARYGDTEIGRSCLLARRLVERGVRMVQVYYGNSQPWDSHEDIMSHKTPGRQHGPRRCFSHRGSERSRTCSETPSSSWVRSSAALLR